MGESLETRVKKFALESALSCEDDCVLIGNPGETVLANNPNKRSPHLTIIGGVRTGGKTTIIDNLIKLNGGHFTEIKTDVVRHLREDEEVLERPHNFPLIDEYIRRFNTGEYAFGYRYANTFYGVPNSEFLFKESAFPVIGVVSPMAFEFLVNTKYFPRAVSVLITANEESIKTRLNDRLSKMRLSDTEQAKILKKVLQDYNAFQELQKNVDMVFENNNPRIVEVPYNRYIIEKSLERTELIAKRLSAFMKVYDTFYLDDKQHEKVPNYLVFEKYFKGILSSLGSKEIPKESEVKIPITLDDIQPSTIISSYINDFGIVRKKFSSKVLKKKGNLYRTNGSIMMKFPPPRGPLSERQLQLLGLVRYAISSNYVSVSDQVNRLLYSLTDFYNNEPAKPYKLHIGF